MSPNIVDPLDNPEAVAQWFDTTGTVDSEIGAFVAEPDRLERLNVEAKKLRRGWRGTPIRPLLYGIPVAVKDVIHVDGLPTSAGSALPPSELAGPQASLIDTLTAAGAVVAGKTVTAEFALSAPGPTRNPRNLDHTPGGSSSGSAAAVAAGMAPLAIGTQTVGSTIRPAAYCGIVGFKPSYGRLPTDGTVANSPSLDTIGLFAADLDWLGLVCRVVVPQWQPPATAATPRLAIPAGRYLSQATSAARTLFADQVDGLRRNGFEVAEVPFPEDITLVNQRHRTINRFEFALGHKAWYAGFAELYRRESAEAVQEGLRIPVSEYHAALEAKREFTDRLAETMRREGVEVWLSPAATAAAPLGLTSTGDATMNLPWTHAGVPVVNLPAGVARNGLPLGMQCAAAPGRDEDLLHWAPEIAAALPGLPAAG